MDSDSLIKIESVSAPRAIGPYSQAVSSGGMVFVSGQIPLDPGTGKLVNGGISEQTQRVLDSVKSILSECGLSFGNVVRSEVFLTDMDDFAAMNEVYIRNFISDVKPARYVVQVARLPMNALIEIACIAVI